MEPTPTEAAITEAAITEQQQRVAAFARARRKLAATRAHRESTRKTLPSWLLLALTQPPTVPAAFMIIAAVVFAGVYRPSYFALPSTSLDPSILLVQVLVVGVAAYTLVRLWRWLRFSPAERTVRLFYNVVGKRDGSRKVIGSGNFVIAEDFDVAPRREPGFNPDAGLPQLIADESDLDAYWSRLTMPKKAGRRLLIKSVSLTPLADDLKLARVKLQPSRPPWHWAFPAFVTFVIPVFILQDQFQQLRYGDWVIPAFLLERFHSSCSGYPQWRK